MADLFEAVTAFASTWTANRIGGRASGLTIGLMLTLGLLFNLTKLPYVVWFKIAIVPSVVAAIVLALRPPTSNHNEARLPLRAS